jgi:DNA-binding transcriptional LysR family regulator
MHADLIRVIRFGLYASPAFAEWKSATAREISKLPFIMRIPGTPIDAIVQEALRHADIWPENVAARAQFNQVAVNLACQGAGVSPLFDTMVEDEMSRGELIKFDLELQPRFRAMFRLEREPSPAMRAAAAFLREIL